MVRDALGNTSAPVFTTITTSDCGARVPTASVVASSSTTYVLGVVTLSATATSTETGCPARFQTTGFGYAWSIVSQPSSAHATLGSISGPTSGFRSDTPGVYVIRMVATGSDGVAALPVDTTITVSDCGMQPPIVSGFGAVQHRYDGVLLSNPSLLDHAGANLVRGRRGRREPVELRSVLSAVHVGMDADAGACRQPRSAGGRWDARAVAVPGHSRQLGSAARRQRLAREPECHELPVRHLSLRLQCADGGRRERTGAHGHRDSPRRHGAHIKRHSVRAAGHRPQCAALRQIVDADASSSIACR